MASFQLLAVAGYTDGSETYLPMNACGQPLTEPLNETGLAIWLLNIVLPVVDRNRWIDIGKIVPPIVRSMAYNFVFNVYTYGHSLHFFTDFQARQDVSHMGNYQHPSYEHTLSVPCATDVFETAGLS